MRGHTKLAHGYGYSMAAAVPAGSCQLVARAGRREVRVTRRGLVVYFSWVGNTAAVADEIQRVTGFDVMRIREGIQRRDGDIPRAGFDSMRGYRSPLEPMDFAMTGYDRVLLGAQVWAGRTTPPINSFLEQADFTGKQVWLFLTRSDPKNPPKTIASLRERIEVKGGTLMDNITFTTNITSVIPLEKFQADLHRWLERNDLLA